jgi:putative transposase
MLKKHRNTPAHLFLDDTTYFVTGAIYQKRYLLKDPEIKDKLLDLIQTYFTQYNWELHHWVILDNHYHILGRSRKGTDLTSIFRSIHSRSAISIRQTTHCAKPVWWNYWDYCPRNEVDYIIRLNYLLMNPIKHEYVNDLHDWPFSSFHTLFAEKGRQQLVKQFRNYPQYRTLILNEVYDDDF